MAETWLALLLPFWTEALRVVLAQMQAQVMEVPVGATVVMPCPSNDDEHIFQFWQLVGDRLIGPTNLPSRDKYKFDVPSGTLYIRSVSTLEAGVYKCISKNIDNKRLVVKAVELIVRKSPEESEDTVFEANLFWGLVSAGAVLILLLVGSLLFLICRRRGTSKFAEAEDEEVGAGSAVKVGTYNPTTVPINTNQKPGPSQGFDNLAMETDFPRVFQSLQHGGDDKL